MMQLSARRVKMDMRYVIGDMRYDLGIPKCDYLLLILNTQY